MQFLTFVGAIANGGQAAQPYLVASVDQSYQAKTTLLPRIMEEDTAQTLAALMVNNVETVYGSWNFPAQIVGAKSGTAEQEGALPMPRLQALCRTRAIPWPSLWWWKTPAQAVRPVSPLSAPC